MPLDSASRRAALMVIDEAVEARQAHLRRHLDENGENLGRHPRVAQASMASLGREPEVFRERIEAFALERRHEAARHPQRAEDRIVEPEAEDAAELEIEEGKIERGVMRHHDGVAEEL